ncbi:hypothetical protein D3C75_493570 [compost metagenome]
MRFGDQLPEFRVRLPAGHIHNRDFLVHHPGPCPIQLNGQVEADHLPSPVARPSYNGIPDPFLHGNMHMPDEQHICLRNQLRNAFSGIRAAFFIELGHHSRVSVDDNNVGLAFSPQ